MDKKIQMMLDGFIGQLLEKVGSNIESIVLFGSYAKGRQHRYSDIDLLIIVRNIPAEWRAREEHAVDLKFAAETEYGKTFSIILATPSEIRGSVRTGSPFYLSILDGYRILFDRNAFFRKELRRFGKHANAHPSRKYRMWEVPA